MRAKTDRNNIERDLNSKAVISTDKEGLRAYKSRKKALRDKDSRLSRLERDVDEIKSLLGFIAEKLRAD